MKRMLILIAAVLLACVGGKGRGAGDRLPILSAGVSASSDGQLLLTAEAVRQDSLEGNAASLYLTTSGDDPAALFTGAEQLLAGQLYLSHARTFVIDEAVALESIAPLVQVLLAQDDVRLTLRLAVARVGGRRGCDRRRDHPRTGGGRGNSGRGTGCTARRPRRAG